MSADAIQTAVMDALPHAIHPIHESWRDKADALIEGLRQRGYVIVPAVLVGAASGVAE